MPVIRTVAAVAVAALAVIGFYSLLHVAINALVSSREVTVTVILRRPVDPPTLDLLLDEAYRHPLRHRGRRVALLLHAPLLEGTMGEGGALAPDYRELVERYGATVYTVDMDA